MPQVKSKYKNPDKYIEKLKSDLYWSKRTNNRLCVDAVRERGNFWVNFDSLHEINIRVTTANLDSARLNHSILLYGTIIGYRKNGDDKHDITLGINKIHLSRRSRV